MYIVFLLRARDASCYRWSCALWWRTKKEAGEQRRERWRTVCALERSPPRRLHPCSVLLSPAAKFGKVRKLPLWPTPRFRSYYMHWMEAFSRRAPQKGKVWVDKKKHVARFGGGIWQKPGPCGGVYVYNLLVLGVFVYWGSKSREFIVEFVALRERAFCFGDEAANFLSHQDFRGGGQGKRLSLPSFLLRKGRFHSICLKAVKL